MNSNFIIKIISFLYFYSPIIVSAIFLLMSAISFFKGYDFYQKFMAGVVGVLSIAITSIFLSFLPQISWSDIITFWIFKIGFTFFILFAIFDASQGKYNGVKGLFGILIFAIAMTLIEKLPY